MVHKYQSARLEAGKKPATVNRELALLKTMFNKAIEARKAASNPVVRVEAPEREQRPVPHPGAGGEGKAEGQDEPARSRDLRLHEEHGTETGELFNLKWSDIDLKSRFLRVWTSKSGEGRTVPLNETAVSILREIPYRIEGGYVFCHPQDGGMLKSIRKAFEGAIRRAKIEDYHFHDTRHEFASALAMRGIDLNTIRELLGHKTMEMVMRYAHLTDRYKAQAVSLLDSAEGSKTDRRAGIAKEKWD